MTGSAFRFRLVLAAWLLFLPGSAWPRSPEAAATVVVFNNNDPDSADLAKYYAQRRDIPFNRIIGLDCPLTEEISRADFQNLIANPLRKVFFGSGWWKKGTDPLGRPCVSATSIRFLALVRGMPLKIAPEGGASSPPPLPDQPPQVASRNDASVDSELAALGLGATSPSGPLPNPVFQRFTPILNDVVNPGLLLPARLDAPTASIVRAMIDDSIATEKVGLWGWAWVDGRGISKGGYALGDAWLGRLVAQMRAFGIPVYFDQLPPTFPSGFPITDPAVYYGWYEWQACGPFSDPLFQFLPGAVAVHIHSFSAATLRSPTANWCGPLLVKGAAATLGNVYEPYLSLSANLDVFQDRLLHGFTLAESGWMAQPALSWMGVVIGDPLYRPYAAWKSTAAPNADTPWKTLRAVVTRSGGSPIDAAAPLAAASKSSGNSLFLETLGLAQSDAGFPRLALGSFQDALSLPNSKSVRLRLRLETIRTLESLGQSAEAGALARLAAAEAGPGSSLFNSFLPPPAPKP